MKSNMDVTIKIPANNNCFKSRLKRLQRITADYQREMEATWNRWEDSDGEVERRLASDK